MMRPGPVIFLVSHSAPGGAQEIWADLAEGFSAAGHQVRLMALYPSPDGSEMSSQLCWHKVRDAKPSSLAGAVDLFAELVRIFRRERPAMVFAAMPAANVLAPLAAHIASVGARVCISHHSPVSTHQRFLNFLDGITGSLECTSSIISVSDAVARSLETKPQAYRHKRSTIHNALPPRVEARLQMLCTARGALPARRRRVVAIGRLAVEKNYPVLLRSAVRMAGVEIVIVGAGPLEASLKGLADALGVSSRVRFLGHLPREETMEVLASADVFAQPSIFEGHSLALMEAARLGVPLVVSDVAAQIEGITRSDGTRCGIAVGLHDDQALANALLKLIDDPAFHRRWAGAAAQLAEEASYVRMLSAYQGLMTP
jgi:glycosyltransferase involved in cell wall biosynthesis